MKIENYLDHNNLIPFYSSEGIEISEKFENTPILSYIIKNNNNLIAAITCSKVEKTFIIESIAVNKNYRNQHIGTNLLNIAINKMIKMGAKNIIANVKNTIFFEKNDFIIIDKENIPINVYSYCFNCPEYQVNCFPKIMKLKNQ